MFHVQHRFSTDKFSDTQTFGPGIFGVSDTPRYSPTAATGISTAIHSAVGRTWICILVDETLNILRGGGERTQELSLQRARGYQDLNQALRSRHEHYQEALMALTICGLTEFRFGTDRSRDMHTTATDMFLRSKGSLKEALAAAPNIEPFYISGQFGFGRCYFPTTERFESTRERWKFEMLSILACARPSSEPARVQGPKSEGLRKDYRSREARIIKVAVEATMTIAPPTMFAAGMQLNLLVELAWTILQFASRHDLAIIFLKRVEYLAKGSFVDGRSGDKSFELRGAALAAMVSRARRDVLGIYYPTELADSDASITNIHINSLKMFHYLEPEGRYLLINQFSNWLQQKEFTTDQPSIAANELAILDAQLTETWLNIGSTPP